MKASVKQIGSGSNLKVLVVATDDNGKEYIIRKVARMSPKFAPKVAEAIVTSFNEYYGGGEYVPEETSPEASEAAQTAIDNYIADQEASMSKFAASASASQEAYNTYSQSLAELEAGYHAVPPTVTEEEYEVSSSMYSASMAKELVTMSRCEASVSKYEANIESAADKAPAPVVTEVPEVLVLDNTPKKGWKVEADFTANPVTTVEANEQVTGGITIKNTGEEPANLVINVGDSDVTLATNSDWNEVVVESVANDTLTVATHTHIKKLILKKGHVKVNNALVSDCIEEVVVEGGTVDANSEVDATSLSKLATSTPSVVNINADLTGASATTGIFTSGHFVYNNNANVNFTKTGANLNGGFLLRGSSKMLAEFRGEGEWHSMNNPTIWLSNFEGLVKIYSGKFFNDANHAETIYAEKGFIEIYGGEFHNTLTEGKNFLLNCYDANYKASKSNITVYGGKFYGFDPAHNGAESSDESTNFVAEGYESVYIEEGGYYEVRKIEQESEQPSETEPSGDSGEQGVNSPDTNYNSGSFHGSTEPIESGSGHNW